MTESPYVVEFTLGSEEKDEVFRAISAGEAFALCKQKYPDCKLKRCLREGAAFGSRGYTYYEPPPGSNDRPLKKEPRSARKPRRDDPDGSMPFYDSTKTREAR